MKMVRLLGATLLLLAPIHVCNAGSLTFLKSTQSHQQEVQAHQQIEPHHHGMGMGKGHGKHHGMGKHNGMGKDNHHRHHRGECWEHRPVHPRFAKASLIQQTPHTLQEPQLALPGAGMHPDEIDPYQMVTKDGFLLVACAKDAMLEHGDKFGNGKHRYKMEGVSNVSIVHYAEIIPKEDREKMTINKCFDFCRTVPNMVYFGLQGGRDCYCTPYYKPMAGDNSNCDETCEGDPSQMCGGKTRSSVFEMHSCDDTRSELEDIITKVEDAIFLHLQDLLDHVNDIVEEGLYDATEMQKVWGLAGDPDMSNYMQEVKVYTGELQEPAEKAQALVDRMQDPYDAATLSLNRNLRDFENIKVAEDAIKALQEGLEEQKQLQFEMLENMKKAHPVSLMGYGEDDDSWNSTGAAGQYYPIMYFVEDDYRHQYAIEKETMWHHPTTCTGKLLQIIFRAAANDCAHACDGLPGKCDGFQYISFNDGMCFLFESVTTVQQWTGCHQNTQDGKTAPFNAQCMGKLSRLESVGGIAPREDKVLEEAQGVRQGTGKCAHCLKKFEKFDRCYEYGTKCLGNKFDFMTQYEWYQKNWGTTYWWMYHSEWNNTVSSCDRMAIFNRNYCNWETGRPNMYSGTGYYHPADQVCPQCGYCIDNGRQSGDPGPDWTNENWEGDPIQNVYYYYY